MVPMPQSLYRQLWTILHIKTYEIKSKHCRKKWNHSGETISLNCLTKSINHYINLSIEHENISKGGTSPLNTKSEIFTKTGFFSQFFFPI